MLNRHGTSSPQFQLPTPLRLNREGTITVLIRRPSFDAVLLFAALAGLAPSHLTGTWMLIALYGGCILLAFVTAAALNRRPGSSRGPRVVAAGLTLAGLVTTSGADGRQLWALFGAVGSVAALTIAAEVGFRVCRRTAGAR